MNPFVIADRLTAAEARQRVVSPNITEPRTYSRMSTCVPTHQDLWLDLEQPVPNKTGHRAIADRTPNWSSGRQNRKDTGRQNPAQNRLLRRRSTFDRRGDFRTPDTFSRPEIGPAVRSRQGEDMAMNKAYQHAGELPGAQQIRNYMAVELELNPDDHRIIQHEGNQETLAKPSERSTPFRRPSTKQSSPGLDALKAPDQLTLKQPERMGSGALNTEEGRTVYESRTLSPLMACRQEQSGLLNSTNDRLTKASTRSSPYLAQANRKDEALQDYAPDHRSDTASMDQGSLLQQSCSRPYERYTPKQTSQIDYPAGLRHYIPTGAGLLKKIQSSSALMRKAPPFANLHSRHRSPNLLDDCGYCELEEVQGIMPASHVVIPDVPPSSNESPRESYHTAESSTSSRILRRIRESKENLRSSETTSAQSSEAATARPSVAPSSSGTAVPLGNIAGMSPHPDVQQAVPVRHSDHDCE
ncbi:hypothetical protein BR93DRAFT_465611 [Coniochaeta sp. PMI_546]|nr:hypothetical protein BR93DRAFT_465611 [Coniochaeta sp. PMI_546]